MRILAFIVCLIIGAYFIGGTDFFKSNQPLRNTYKKEDDKIKFLEDRPTNEETQFSELQRMPQKSHSIIQESKNGINDLKDSMVGEEDPKERIPHLSQDQDWQEELDQLSLEEQKDLRKLASQIDKALNDEEVESTDEDIGSGDHFHSQDEYQEAVSDALDDEESIE